MTLPSQDGLVEGGSERYTPDVKVVRTIEKTSIVVRDDCLSRDSVINDFDPVN